jgi:hypothetical protein
MFKLIAVVSLAFVSFLSVVVLRGSADDKPAEKERVFEMRTYIAAPGKLDDLNSRFRNHTNALFKKHGMELIGYWTPTAEPGSKNTLIYILAYPSKDAADKSWKEFRDDPEWKKVVQQTEANGKLVEKVESVYMKPTDYSPIK